MLFRSGPGSGRLLPAPAAPRPGAAVDRGERAFPGAARPRRDVLMGKDAEIASLKRELAEREREIERLRERVQTLENELRGRQEVKPYSSGGGVE